MRALAFAIGLTVFFLGITTEIGYLLGWSRLYIWDHSIGMAINTGFGFTLTGLAICILSSRTCGWLRNCPPHRL